MNTLGQPIDGKGPVDNDGFSPVEVIAPGVIDRQLLINQFKLVINQSMP